MIKKILLLLSVIIVMCTMSSCENVGTKKGKVIVFDFDSNPTTGYDWGYEFANEENSDIFELTFNDYKSEATKGMVGTGGIRTFKFKATKEGKQGIIFTYRRPWEGGESAYDVLYELEVDKNLNIKCINKLKGMINSDKEVSSFPDPTFE